MISERTIEATDVAGTRAPPVGRTLRFLVGAWLVFVVMINLHRPDWRTAVVLLVTLAALSVYYGLLHRLLGRRPINAVLAKVVALLPLAVFLLARDTDIQVGILAFYGISLLLAAVRGDGGCEVMSLPNLVFQQTTHLPCLLFSPLDRLEERIRHAARRTA